LPDIDEIGDVDDEKIANDIYDTYIGAEVQLPGQGNQMQMARVVKCIKGNDGNPINAS
jgi:hypothetical protein